MPGGRLTNQDRQRIAEGLAGGLGFAEIARTLGRPTSTISREVARNSEPDGYHPAAADQVTHQRARRPKATGTPSAPEADDTYGRDPDAVRGFEERFSTLMITSGLPAMMARVLTCLLTHDSETITAAELVQRLQVSPASISKATRYLEQLGLLRRTADGRRRQLYLIDSEIWYRAWESSAQAARAWADIAHQGVDVLGTSTPAGARLDEASRFYRLLSHDLIQAAERRREDVIAARASTSSNPSLPR